MFEPMVESFYKTAESTLQAQQDLVSAWYAGVLGKSFRLPPTATVMDQTRSFQKQVMAAVIATFKKHRETVDAQYGLAIQALEEAFRVGDTREPSVFLQRSEELYRHGFNCVRAVAEDQIMSLQAATHTWLDVVTKGTQAGVN